MFGDVIDSESAALQAIEDSDVVLWGQQRFSRTVDLVDVEEYTNSLNSQRHYLLVGTDNR